MSNTVIFTSTDSALCSVCTHVALGGLSVHPTAWGLNGSYVRRETGQGPQADVQYPPETPTAVNIKYALVFLVTVEQETLRLFEVFSFSS